MEPTGRGRCPTHDLALGPLGDCVLCRRPPASELPPPRGPVALSLVGLGLVAALVVVLGLAFGVRSLVSSPPPTPPVLAVSEPPTAPPATERRTRTEPPARERVRSGTSTREPTQHEPTAAEAPTEAPAEPDRYAMQSARRRVSITMYSASWCPTCRSAEAYLREHRIRFTRRDIEDGERNRERLRELNPAGSIPTFELDERVVVGFGPHSFEAALDEAALARVIRR